MFDFHRKSVMIEIEFIAFRGLNRKKTGGELCEFKASKIH